MFKISFKCMAITLFLLEGLAIAYMAPPLDRPRYIQVESPNDHEMTEQLRQSIKNDYYLAPYYDQINISTQGGIITLNGYLNSYAIRLRLEQFANRVPRVRKVVDNTQVDPTPPYVPPL